MPLDPKADVRAMVLATSIVAFPVEATGAHLRRRAAIYEAASTIPRPLDLTGLRFVYRRTGDAIEPLRPRHGAACRRRSNR